VAGSFSGAEIEPGTFHVKALTGPSDRVNQHGTDAVDTSPSITQSGGAQGKDAANAAVPKPEQEAPVTRS